MSPRALIIGSGIGGLSAAIALRHAGWAVRVFERAASPRELGFGVALAPNAVAALHALSVGDTVLARSFAPEVLRWELCRPDGTVIRSGAFPVRAAIGTLAVALRPALHGALLDAVGLDGIECGREAASFSSDGDRVTVQFTGGGAASGHVLIGADGFGSAVRRQLHPAEGPARQSGIVALRGAVHGAEHHLGDCSAVYYLGPGIESIFTRASDTGIYWFISLARELVPDGMRDPRALLAHMAPRFDARFRAISSATDDLRVDEIADRDPVPYWSRGRVALLGDAAHPLLPQTGQGAAQAMEDAVALGRILTPDADIPAALAAYERERKPRVTKLLWQGRRTAKLMKMTSPLGCAVREHLIRLMPIESMVQLSVRLRRKKAV